jgi:hypothetical protein
MCTVLCELCQSVPRSEIRLCQTVPATLWAPSQAFMLTLIGTIGATLF